MKHNCLLLLSIFATVGASCPPEQRDCVCTDEFRSYVVTIVNVNHEPLDSLVTYVTGQMSRIIRTDSSHVRNGIMNHGQYVVLTDGEKQYFRTTPLTVIFHASDRNHIITQAFSFYVDDCGCHLQKFSGPDSIVVNQLLIGKW